MINANRTIEREEERYGGFSMPVVPDAKIAEGKSDIVNRTQILAPATDKKDNLVIKNPVVVGGYERTAEDYMHTVVGNSKSSEYEEVYYDGRERSLPRKIKALLFGYLFFVMAIVVGVIALGAAVTSFEASKAAAAGEGQELLQSEAQVYTDIAVYSF